MEHGQYILLAFGGKSDYLIRESTEKGIKHYYFPKKFQYIRPGALNKGSQFRLMDSDSSNTTYCLCDLGQVA